MFKSIESIKRKSILFVLILISILLLTLYFQNKTSNKNFLIQTSKNYKTNFDNYYVYFKKQLILFYEVQTIYIQENPKYIAQLINKKRFLKDIKIVNFKEEKIQTIYSDEALKGKSFLDIEVTETDIFYKVIVPIKKDNKIESYALYKVDSRFFLKSVKDFNGSDGLIFIIDDNKNNDVFLDENKDDKFFQEMAQKCEEEKDTPVVKYEDNIYAKKIMSFKNFKNKETANAIFFLDISDESKAYKTTLRDSVLTSIILFIIAMIMVKYFFTYLINQIEKREKELKSINKNLEEMVEKEIEHRLEIQKEAQEEKTKSEHLLMQQSKLAMLGEMIGNIAHQWRQPLMQLSAILMYLDAYNEKGKLTPEKFTTKIKDGNSIIDFMSKTIEDFRNYYKPEKQKEKFLLKNSIDNALFIVNSSLKTSNIEVITKYSNKNIELESFKNEFSQALLNIITNAKDILIIKKIKDAKIFIDVKEDKKNVTISIEDNAGGIDDDIINKIFDPYFTTKHKSQGTGIGLYMTKMIIENNMHGKIEVENSKRGAKFIISLKV